MEDGLKGLFGLLDSDAAELDEVKPRELTDKMIQNIAGKQFGKRVTAEMEAYIKHTRDLQV